MKAFGDSLRERRWALGFTQKQLAQRLHVTSQAISKWETGASCPDIALLPRIADCLGVSVDALLRGDDDKKAQARTDDELRRIALQLLEMSSRDGN